VVIGFALATLGMGGLLHEIIPHHEVDDATQDTPWSCTVCKISENITPGLATSNAISTPLETAELLVPGTETDRPVCPDRDVSDARAPPIEA
jgi:hypothetical protein